MRPPSGPALLGVLAVALLLMPLASCKRANMVAQAKSRTWDRSTFFSDQMAMRTPVAGSVARNAPNQPAPQPAAIDAAMLVRGQQRYDIYCAACHGSAGYGDGMIVQRGFPRPPSFHDAAQRSAKAARFYDAITNGHGTMYSFADRVSPQDRWAVIAYIRALQFSQATPAADLLPPDLAQLAAAK